MAQSNQDITQQCNCYQQNNIDRSHAADHVDAFRLSLAVHIMRIHIKEHSPNDRSGRCWSRPGLRGSQPAGNVSHKYSSRQLFNFWLAHGYLPVFRVSSPPLLYCLVNRGTCTRRWGNAAILKHVATNQKEPKTRGHLLSLSAYTSAMPQWTKCNVFTGG